MVRQPASRLLLCGDSEDGSAPESGESYPDDGGRWSRRPESLGESYSAASQACIHGDPDV